VRNEDAVAQHAGLEVCWHLVRSDQYFPSVRVIWSGVPEQFEATGLGYKAQAISQTVRSRRISTPWDNKTFVRVGPNEFSASTEITLARQIRRLENIEIQDEYICTPDHYTSNTTYHGRPEDLVAAGIMPTTKRVPIGRSPSGKWYCCRRAREVDKQSFWTCSLLFDGTVTYGVEVHSQWLLDHWARLARERAAEEKKKGVERWRAEAEEQRIERRVLKANAAKAQADQSFAAFMRRILPST